MAKTAILSNGNLSVGLNEFGLVSDLYFPDNGYENHTLGEEIFHRIGVQVDGKFSWLNSGEWEFRTEYFADALIAKTFAQNSRLDVEIEIKSAVSSDMDVFLREITVKNLADFSRNGQIFFYQNFSINGGRHLADTVQFIPGLNYILHYRGKRAFVVSAEKNIEGNNFEPFSQHTVGLFGIENKLGSWVDCEDGILSGANVEHGQTDSAFGVDFNLEAGEISKIQYSISCADDHDLAFENSKKTQGKNFEKSFEKTHRWWQKWLAPTIKISKNLPEKYQQKFIQSVMLVKSHIAKSGAPIASNDSEMLRHARDDYSYCWPRDALFALWPLIRIGYFDESEKFFDFCAKSKNPAGFMNHKFLPNGEIGPSWHPYSQGGDSKNLPIQIDETAGIVFLFAQFHSKFKNSAALNKFYPTLIKPMADFLVGFLGDNNLPKPNYELWEMDFLSTIYSSSVVFAALNSAAQLAQEFEKPQDAYVWKMVASRIKSAAKKEFFNVEREYFYRGIWPHGEKDSKIDVSSFYGAFIFGLFDFDSEEISKSFATLQKRFNLEQNIAIPRFENDVYYRSSDEYEANFWPITSLWIAEYYLAKNQIAEAEKIIDWVSNRTSSAGIIPEQIDPRDLSWLSVAPLTWSQAEYVSSLLDYIAATKF